MVGIRHCLAIGRSVNHLGQDGTHVGAFRELPFLRKLKGKSVRCRLRHCVRVREVDGTFKHSSCACQHQQTLWSKQVTCKMACKKRSLEVDAVLLFVLLHDILILDVAETKSASNADYRVVLGLSFSRLREQVADLKFQGLVFVDDDITACVWV